MDEAYTRLRGRLEGLGDDEEGHALLRSDLDGLAQDDLDAPRLTNWGERWPAWRIFQVMIDHDALHAGMIGALRDLYRWRPGAARPGGPSESGV